VVFRIPREGYLIVDVGDDEDIFVNNFKSWEKYAGLKDEDLHPMTIVLSHGHTFGPHDPIHPKAERSDGMAWLLGKFSDVVVMGPNLNDFMRLGIINRLWLKAGFSPGPGDDLKPGVKRLSWSDGTLSTVRLVSYPFAPHSDDVPFTPYETVTVIPTDHYGCPGYLIYSVCSHMRLPAGRGGPSGPVPFHAGFVVKEAMDEGLLPPGRVHTIVTGTCDAIRIFTETGGRLSGGKLDGDLFMEKLRRMKSELGVERVVFVHCALERRPVDEIRAMYRVVFGENVLNAFPGSVVSFCP
jgi:hypothetical protein